MMNDPLGIGLQQRARSFRQADDQDSEQRAMAIGGLQAQLQAQMNNGRSAAMAQATSPQWDGMFQALRESGGGRSVRMADGAPFGNFGQVGIGRVDEGGMPTTQTPTMQMPAIRGLMRANKKQRSTNQTNIPTSGV